ncbi:DUF3268 family zinc-finger domain-containing protein [Gemmata sp. JC717]|uniref:DUF3268 family zinc-finger domain-containing protein n=1 Tax=Gemmata algarum TaxID=2975278 RepID=UPI0021BA7E8C|nr:DUF3268 family zinc-finger domain-containing protein [Gemmata algarum]MDY3551439.1 DUF3268 family zinc-finger domain-containing protein [Gemmata algarum]
MTARKIFCCGCGDKVEARLTSGAEVYPHRADLADLPFWKCDGCGNWVGCHHKTTNRTNPLGNIPTKELKNARQHIHRLLDPLWQSGIFRRSDIYAKLTEHMGFEYHTAQLRTLDEARKAYKFIKELAA